MKRNTINRWHRQAGVRTRSVELLERRVLLSAIYVDDTAGGAAQDGASWASAFRSLQAALDRAAVTAGRDEIHVAAGTYRPSARTDPGDPRSATFLLSNGVSILGGYPDGGGAAAARDPAVHVTTLSGDIGIRGSAGDNSFHVVTATGVDGTAALNGLTITGGNANGTDSPQPRSRGGGMYVSAASPTLTRCVFDGNSARVYGGGMFNGGGSAPVLLDCTFARNTSAAAPGETTSWGGGMANIDSAPELTGCTFTGNTSYLGGGMYNNASSPSVTGCTFAANSAGSGAGVAEVVHSSSSFTGCVFSGNLTDGVGGGAWIADSTPEFSGCTFTGNSADAYGGAASSINSAPRFDACTFGRNRASWYGGAIYDIGPTAPRLTNCSFTGNSAALGGAVHNRNGATPLLVSCAFSGNTAESYGGAVYNDGSAPTLINCTFSGNSANSGGAIGSDGGSSPALSNCIVWGNVAAVPGTSAFAGGPTAAHHSLVEGGWPGAGNIAADPLFARNPSYGPDGVWNGAGSTTDDDYGDLRLLLGSPGVDAGDSGAVPDDVATDLAGQPRVAGAAVDVGAYERPEAVTYEAEWGAGAGAGVKNSNGGYTGTGYMDYGTRVGDSLELTVRAGAAGPHLLAVRYANGGSADRPLQLSVNGRPVGAPTSFPRTGSWLTWGTVTVPVTLAAGDNVVRLTATTAAGPNVDSLTLRPASRTTYQAESAALSGPRVYSDHGGYTGSGFADYRHADTDYVEFTIDVPADGTWALDFRYANGGTSDRPLEMKVDGNVVAARLGFAPTGSWGTWRTAGRSVHLSGGRHTVRLTAVGSSGPNLDRLTVRRVEGPDTTPPRVVGLSLQHNGVLAPGDQTVIVEFSEPMKVSNLSPFDVYPDTAFYEGRWPESMSYDATRTVLTIRLADLRDDFGVMGFNIDEDGFVDAAGNVLDGEPVAFPIPPNVTGDGVAGGEFYFTFYVDTPGAVLLDLPDPIPPGGATVVGESGIALPVPGGDADSFTLGLRTGQVVRADVTSFVEGANAFMQPVVELRDPAGALVASATAADEFSDVSLPPVTAKATGTYTLTVRSALNRFGRFRATVQVADPAAQAGAEAVAIRRPLT